MVWFTSRNHSTDNLPLGPFWGQLIDQYGLKIMAVRISVVSLIIWLLMWLAREIYELFVLRILSGFFGGFGSLSVSLATHWCPSNRVSRAIGSLQATQTFSMALGPFVGGMLAVWIGIQNTFFVTAALSFLTLLVFFLLKKLILSSQLIKFFKKNELNIFKHNIVRRFPAHNISIKS